MKRTDLSKLSLKKTTIRVLDNSQLGDVAGGGGFTNYAKCSNSCSNPTATICNRCDYVPPDVTNLDCINP